MPSGDNNTAVRRFDLTTFGEAMLRLSVPAGTRLEAASTLDVQVGGAESNVCAALAGLGRNCGWMSALPENELGDLVFRRLREAGVDTSRVIVTPGTRVGLYFVEYSRGPRPIQVIYDRANSAVTQMKLDEVDWSYLLDTRVLHITGITPALGATCYAITKEAMQRARELGVLVSFDVNYRSRLWSPDEAATCLQELFPFIDLLFCGKQDSQTLFGIQGDDREVLDALRNLTSVTRIVLTLGDAGAAALDGADYTSVKAHEVEVVDRLGAGDAFAAGVIDGWLDGSIPEGLNRGTALAALALSQHGDMLITNRKELELIQALGHNQTLLQR